MSGTLRVSSFFALVEEKRKKVVKSIDTEPKLHKEMVSLFESQASELYSPNNEVIPFNPRFTPEPDHIFRIESFSLPENILHAVKNPHGVSPFVLSDEDKLGFKGIFASSYDSPSGAIRVLFQHSGPSRVLKTGHSIFMSKGLFKKIESPGLSLESDVVAIYDSGSLFFRKFSAVNSLVDLKDYFMEATTEEVSAVLGHNKFASTDVDSLVNLCDMSMRRRVAFIKQSCVLDSVSVRIVCSSLKKIFADSEVSYKTKDGKDSLQLPSTKKELKRLLNHLCEYYYEGLLTGQKYEANSHRNLA